MFLGQYHLHLDENHQLTVPATMQGLLAGGVYITRGFEQNLLIMSEAVFQEIYKRVMSLNLADPLARLLVRLIVSNASRLELNESGGVTIPEALQSAAGLERDLVLVGQGNYLEVWAPTPWEKQASDLLNTDANSERFAQLDLAFNRA
jgi:MraZ protein